MCGDWGTVLKAAFPTGPGRYRQGVSAFALGQKRMGRRRAMAPVVLLAPVATCRRQGTEAIAPLIFQIPVSLPNY